METYKTRKEAKAVIKKDKITHATIAVVWTGRPKPRYAIIVSTKSNKYLFSSKL